MRVRGRYKKGAMRRMVLLLLCLTIVSAYMTVGLLARYITSGGAERTGKVAVFEIESAGDIFTQTFVVELSPADGMVNAGSAFRLINKSETAVKCTYSITYTENLPLSFQWTHGGVLSEEVVLRAGESTDEVQLQVKLDQQNDSYLFHREIDHVTLTITCEQID